MRIGTKVYYFGNQKSEILCGTEITPDMRKETKMDKHSLSKTNWFFQSQATYKIKEARLRVYSAGGSNWCSIAEKLERIADHLEATEY